MASSDTYASIPVASEGNLVPFINGRDFQSGSQTETLWWGSGGVYAGSETKADPFGNGGGSYAPGAAYFKNGTTANTYLIYNVVEDLMTQNTGVKRIIKDGTALTWASYIRNRNAPRSFVKMWDLTSPTNEIKAGAYITWASSTEGAAVDEIDLLSNAGTGSRFWYEDIGSEGWIRVFCELIMDTSVCHALRAELQPNTSYATVADAGCFFWGPEVQYGSLNVTGQLGGSSVWPPSGGLYMTGGGVFDVECLVDVEYFRPIRRIPFASGHTYTSGIYRQDRRRWRVTVRAADLTVTQNLQAFFNSHNGMEHPFFFTTPITDTGVGFPWTSGAGHTADTQETVTGYFSEDVLHLQEIGPSVYDISFSVEELLVK